MLCRGHKQAYLLTAIIVYMFVACIHVYAINYTLDDVTLMAHLIASEARGETIDGMCAIANVVINRVEMDAYPNTIHDVIMQDNQFASLYNDVSADCMTAATAVVVDGYRILPPYVDMFQRAKVQSWYGREWICTIGAHNFYGIPNK